MNSAKEIFGGRISVLSPIFADDAFDRLDQSDDGIFYSTPRFVSHLDSLALKTVEILIGNLVVEDSP
ncbi:MAG: hypothetical protein SV775_12935, partial [Thermodesulfobacteriota bacterium]|nr:hypothetical protein [Thermodesulfobacteriota bacterium]